MSQNICNEYKSTKVCVMQTIDDSSFKDKSSSENITREFDVFHLMALPRGHVRRVVSLYNKKKNIGDENAVLEKVLKDLTVLNIHRTPMNCLTLLRVSEGNFDESPANRAKMIEMVLFVIFNSHDLPTYKIRPDVKDCEYVIGRFCEAMIRGGVYRFSRERFIDEVDGFCKEKLLPLEVSIVFDILFENGIIVRFEGDFVFRWSYWVYYFAARRMYADSSFRDYILKEQGYVSFPEIIEFYTGIERDRKDIVEILTEDLREACNAVDAKTGLPEEFNPLDHGVWKTTPESIESMKKSIDDDVVNSHLPDDIKDRFADKDYDQLRAYDQSIQKILDEYLLLALMQKARAASRALRNSDYVDPDLKSLLLVQILRSWKQVSKIIFALSPILAGRGSAEFEGLNFVLGEGFSEDFNERIVTIFKCVPSNVVNIFRYDLYSPKMGPLLYQHLSSEKDRLILHEVTLLIAAERPLGWRKYIEAYIASLPRDSFYLADLVVKLKSSYRYTFASDSELGEIRHLIKLGIAKHEFGGGVGLKEVLRISDQVLPERSVDAQG